MHKMCIHRSCNCNGCLFSIEVEVSYSDDKRNGVYKLCIHHSCNGSLCRFSIDVEVTYSGDNRNGV